MTWSNSTSTSNDVRKELYEKYQRHKNTLGNITQPHILDGRRAYVLCEQGAIFWSPDCILCIPERDIHEIHGPIWNKWNALGKNKYMGYPVSDVIYTEQGSFSNFGYEHTPDAGLLRFRFTTDESDILDSFNDNECGSIYCKEKTAFAIRGAINKKWKSLKGELGYPVSDEIPTEDGHFNEFEGGTLYWTECSDPVKVRMLALTDTPKDYKKSNSINGFRARSPKDWYVKVSLCIPGSIRVSFDSVYKFDHEIRKFPDKENFDVWWENLRPTTLLHSAENDDLPLRVFDVKHFRDHKRIKFFTPQSWNMFAIVSHTWKKEVKEWYGPRRAWPNGGYMTIRAFSKDDLVLACKILASLGVKYCWIDSICIDQDSAEEKSREINRMISYYKHPQCYIFPHGIGTVGGPQGKPPIWYSRVWTLQELLVSRHPEHIYIVDSCEDIGELVNVEYHGKKIVKISHANVKQFVSDEVNTKFLWNDSKPTKLDVLRLAGCRYSTYEEDKIYSILGMLNVGNVEIVYGGGLKKALVSVAQSMHVDHRLIFCVAEWAGYGFVDGYCMMPRMLGNLQAWEIEVKQIVGKAFFMGDRGTEITSFISSEIDITDCKYEGYISGNPKEVERQEREHKLCLVQIEKGEYKNLYTRSASHQTSMGRARTNAPIGHGVLGQAHNRDLPSKLVMIGLNNSKRIVSAVCQQAGDTLHKTGLCTLDADACVCWTLGRTIIA